MRWLIIAGLLLGSCTQGGGEAGEQVVVFAAASLRESFGDLERELEASESPVDVSMIFAGSQVLRLQIEQGAKGDVFASASREHMEALQKAGLVGQTMVVGRNQLAVIVPRDNPAGVDSFADLAKAKRVVVGADNVPVGAYTRMLLHKLEQQQPKLAAHLQRAVVSRESNVRLVRAKVEMGEADAAIVYQTDVAPSQRVKMIPIPSELQVDVKYYVGILSEARQPELAQRFVAYLTSAPGKAILARRGFVVEP